MDAVVRTFQVMVVFLYMYFNAYSFGRNKSAFEIYLTLYYQEFVVHPPSSYNFCVSVPSGKKRQELLHGPSSQDNHPFTKMEGLFKDL